MKQTFKILLAGVALVAFAGCNEKVNTVDYYVEHEQEREAKLKECLNNPGAMQNNPNCINAHVALNKSLSIKYEKARAQEGNNTGKTMDDYFK